MIFFLIVAALHLAFAVSAILAVRRSHMLTPKEKQLQYVLILLIPFLWAVIAKGLVGKSTGTHEPNDDLPLNSTRFEERDLPRRF